MQTVIASFPKSGRTWLSFLIANYLNLTYRLIPEINFRTVYQIVNSDGAPVESIDAISKGAIPIFRATHSLPEDVVADRIIRVVRNPYDVLVSFYFHTSRHSTHWFKYEGTLSAFLRDDRWGCPYYKRYHSEWEAKTDIQILKISYEEIHVNTEDVLREVLMFGLVNPVDQDIVTKAVELSSYEALRKIEINGPTIPEHEYDKTDIHSSRVRIGEIGSAARFLTQEDADYISQTLSVPPIQCEADSLN